MNLLGVQNKQRVAWAWHLLTEIQDEKNFKIFGVPYALHARIALLFVFVFNCCRALRKAFWWSWKVLDFSVSKSVGTLPAWTTACSAISSASLQWGQVAKSRVPTLLLAKNPGLYRTPMNNFPGPFRSPRMFKYKDKRHLLNSIQTVVHCRKFSMKQNVDVSCSEFRWTYLHMVSIYMQWVLYCCCFFFPFEPLEKCMTFKDIFQDFPGH